MDIITKINGLLADGRAFCLATVVESKNSQITTGMKCIIHTDGTIEAEFEEQLLDDQVKEVALEAIEEKKDRLIDVNGDMRLFLNVFEPEATMIICGAGHIAIPLADFACKLGFKVTVLDDREDFAHSSRFSPPFDSSEPTFNRPTVGNGIDSTTDTNFEAIRANW
jgi:xanthine dehydrogenase accessory factor